MEMNGDHIMRTATVLLSLLYALNSFGACNLTREDKIRQLLTSDAFTKRMQAQYGFNPKTQTLVLLTYSADSGQWTAYDWKPTSAVTPRAFAQVRADDTPEILLNTDDRVLLLVTETNPLLYKAQPLAVTEKDTAQLEEAKQFVGLVSNLLAGAPTFFGGAIASPTDPDELTQRKQAVTDAMKPVEEISAEINDSLRAVTVYIALIEEGKEPCVTLATSGAVTSVTCGATQIGPLGIVRLDRLPTLLDRLQPAFLKLAEERAKLGTGTSREGEAADKLLANTADLMKAAVYLTRFSELALHATNTPSACVYLDGVVAVEDSLRSSKLMKVRTVGFKLAAVPPEGVTARAPDAVERKADLLPSFSWDLAAALTHVGIDDKSWAPVTNPTNASQLVIGAAKETTRTGQFALMSNLKAPGLTGRDRWYKPALQLGANVDTKKPGFYVGASFGGANFRLGGGWSWQQVQRLAEGQEELVTVITKQEDIRTRSGYDNGPYISLSFSLGGLPFFKPAAE